jgi:hypothetical protein
MTCFFVTWHRDAPVEGGARDRQVLQARFDEGGDLVAALGRTDEIGPIFIERQQFVLIGREPEEVAFLLDPFHRCTLRAIADIVGTEFGFFLAVIGLVANRIPAGVTTLVDVAIGFHRLPDGL